jgi:uracil-DNA glycosylase
MPLSESILHFLKGLSWKGPLPKGVEVLRPFSDPEVMTICTAFYRKYYPDEGTRILLIGINPGRHGAGLTGIPFTDPIRLAEVCGIPNPWPKKRELSSVFIYDMIDAFDGAEAFYRQFYFTAVSPLGFTAQGKNLNYYDNARLRESLEPHTVRWFRQQLAWGLRTDVAFCLGGGENHKYLEGLNQRHGLFSRIVALPHPRYIMQYRLKQKDAYIQEYLSNFKVYCTPKIE